MVPHRWTLLCLNWYDAKKVYFGTTNPWEDQNRVERTIDDFVIHPDFRREDLHRDLCMARLDEPLVFNDKIKPICLNDGKKG